MPATELDVGLHASPFRAAHPRPFDLTTLPVGPPSRFAAVRATANPLSGLGAGEALADPWRSWFEARFQTDFSAVRLHRGAVAAQLAERQQARAFTHGSHIVLGAHSPGPDTPEGRRLLAHELAHTIQQAGPFARGEVSVQALPRGPPSSQRGPLVIQRASAMGVQCIELPQVTLPTLSDVGGAVVEFGEGAWETAADVGGAALGAVGEGLAEVVEFFAPGLMAFLNGGYSGQLTDLFCSGLDGLVGMLLEPLAEIDLVSSIEATFSSLTEGVNGLRSAIGSTASAALGTLLRPIVEALQVYGDPIIQNIASVADSVDNVFSGLWENIAVPALDFLGAVGGAIWTGFTDLLGWLERVTAPLRRAAEWAWNELCEQFSLAWESTGGIRTWLSGVADEVWESFQETIEPIRTPLLIVGGTLLLLSPFGPVIIVTQVLPPLYEKLVWLWNNWNSDDILVAARDILAHDILPAIIGTVSSASLSIATAIAWLAGITATISEQFGGVLGAFGANSCLTAVTRVLNHVVDQFQRLAVWAKGGFKGLGAAVTAVFDALVAIFEPILDFLIRVIMVAANPPMLPIAITAAIWLLCPDELKPAVIDFVIDLLIQLARVMSHLFIAMAPMNSLMRESAIGFLEELRGNSTEDTARKIAVSNKVAGLLAGGGIRFTAGFAVGLLEGLLDGILDPFRIIIMIVQLTARVCTALGNVIGPLLGRVSPEAGGFINRYRTSVGVAPFPTASVAPASTGVAPAAPPVAGASPPAPAEAHAPSTGPPPEVTAEIERYRTAAVASSRYVARERPRAYSRRTVHAPKPVLAPAAVPATDTGAASHAPAAPTATTATAPEAAAVSADAASTDSAGAPPAAPLSPAEAVLAGDETLAGLVGAGPLPTDADVIAALSPDVAGDLTGAGDDLTSASAGGEAAFTGELNAGGGSPRALSEQLGEMWDSALTGAADLGASVARALMEFILLPDFTLGRKLGWVTGFVLFQVVLAYFTAGISAEAEAVSPVLRVIIRFLDLGGEILGLIGRAAGRVAPMFLRFLAPVGRFLGRFRFINRIVEGVMRAARGLMRFGEHAMGAVRRVTDPLGEAAMHAAGFSPNAIAGVMGRQVAGQAVETAVAREGADVAGSVASREMAATADAAGHVPGAVGDAAGHVPPTAGPRELPDGVVDLAARRAERDATAAAAATPPPVATSLDDLPPHVRDQLLNGRAANDVLPEGVSDLAAARARRDAARAASSAPVPSGGGGGGGGARFVDEGGPVRVIHDAPAPRADAPPVASLNPEVAPGVRPDAEVLPFPTPRVEPPPPVPEVVPTPMPTPLPWPEIAPAPARVPGIGPDFGRAVGRTLAHPVLAHTPGTTPTPGPTPTPTPAPAPAPAPAPGPNPTNPPVQIRLELPAEKMVHLARYVSLVSERRLMHQVGVGREDNGQQDRWDNNLRPGGLMGMPQETWNDFENLDVRENRRLRPNWTRTQFFANDAVDPMEVDHIVDDQLVRHMPGNDWYLEMSNLELLDRLANGNAGRVLRANIAKERTRLVNTTGNPAWSTANLIFTTVVPSVGNRGQRWLPEEIQETDHHAAYLRHLRRGAVREGFGPAPPSVPASVGASLAGGGRALPSAFRSRAENFFGADLGGVRVHDDAAAARAAHESRAHAVTVGQHVLLGAQRTNLAAPATQRTLAHEIAHTLQPTVGAGAGGFGRDDAACEREARTAARAFTTPTRPANAPPARLQSSRHAAFHRDDGDDTGQSIEEPPQHPTSPVAYVGIDLVSNEVGFVLADGTLIKGGAVTDLEPGRYSLHPDYKEQKWLIDDVEPGTHFELDFGESADPWQLSYNDPLQMEVGFDTINEEWAAVLMAPGWWEDPDAAPPEGSPFFGCEASPDAFTGIQLYYTVGSIPYTTGVDRRMLFSQGPYLIAPNIVRYPDGPPTIGYYVAYRKKENVVSGEGWNEYVVGPDSIETFLANLTDFQAAAAIPYMFGPPSPYEAESGKMSQRLLEGDYEGAFEAWKNAWSEAVQDPGWWAQVAMARAGPKVGPKAAAPKPTTVVRPPAARPNLRVVVSNPTPGPRPKVVGGPARVTSPPTATRGNLALKLEPAPPPSVSPKPQLRVVPDPVPVPNPVAAPAKPVPGGVPSGGLPAPVVAGAVGVTSAVPGEALKGPDVVSPPATTQAPQTTTQPLPQPQPDPAPQEKKKEETCPGPTGLTPLDPIPIQWFKPFSDRNLYPSPIVLDGLDFAIDNVTTLPRGEPIGVAEVFRPKIGKLVQLMPEPRAAGFDPATGRFDSTTQQYRDALRSYGFDWGARSNLQADHVMDLQWAPADSGEKTDQFNNLWPLDSKANTSAGGVQNNTQVVSFCETKKGPHRSISLKTMKAEARANPLKRFFGRYFTISKIGV